ncbi:MAG: alpha/beta hydrolase [Mycobacterium sp.]|nr:alpha/beta hydrolase [Mycobacterium sp.]
MSIAIDAVPAACTRALHAGSLVLRGSPALASWVLGWLATELSPHALTGHALSALPLPLEQAACGLAAGRVDTVLRTALQDTFGEDYLTAVHHPLENYTARKPTLAGLGKAMRHRKRYAATTTNISYGPGGSRNLLDVWRRPDLPADQPAPVLIQIPGGGWSVNSKRGQAYPLMTRMVELGWICVSINYSRSPRNAWPSHIVDVKRAIAWVRDNIAEFGGDPDFIALTGGSAGGHLSSLAALTPDDRSLQPGFEDADTSVQAAVPFYGVYDLTDHGSLHKLTMPLLERLVIQRRLDENREIYEAASPRLRAHRDAPPFFILHGENDLVVPLTQARGFETALRSAGAATVAYAEVPDAHHAFDAIGTLRCQLTAEAVAAFLGIVYGRHLAAGAGSATAIRPAG